MNYALIEAKNKLKDTNNGMVDNITPMNNAKEPATKLNHNT